MNGVAGVRFAYCRRQTGGAYLYGRDKTMALDEREQGKRQNFIDGLHDLIAWYEARPDYPAPGIPVSADVFVSAISGTSERAAELLGMFGGGVKCDTDEETILCKRFRGPVSVNLWIAKTFTCRKVSKGFKTIPASPAMDAEPERTVEVFEWECPGSLFKALAAERGSDGSDETL